MIIGIDTIKDHMIVFYFKINKINWLEFNLDSLSLFNNVYYSKNKIYPVIFSNWHEDCDNKSINHKIIFKEYKI